MKLDLKQIISGVLIVAAVGIAIAFTLLSEPTVPSYTYEKAPAPEIAKAASIPTNNWVKEVELSPETRKFLKADIEQLQKLARRNAKKGEKPDRIILDGTNFAWIYYFTSTNIRSEGFNKVHDHWQ